MSTFVNVYNSRVFDRAVIQDIIKSCNNLILNKPEDQSMEEAYQHIKDELIPTFVDFYGPKYAERVKEKIQNTQLILTYQILGEKNSIESMVMNQRRKYFEKKYGMKYWAMYNAYQQLMAYERDDNSTITDATFEIIEKLGFSFEDYKNHPSIRVKVKTKIEEAFNVWRQETYSDDPKINADFKKLSAYVEEYQNTLEPLLRESFPSLSKAFPDQVNFFLGLTTTDLINYDPVFQELTIPHVSADTYIECIETILNPEDMSAAFAQTDDDDKDYVCFGIDIYDELLIHELNHVVDSGGFAKAISPRDANYFPDHYTASNEVVNDSFADIMYKSRVKQGKNQLCKTPSLDSFYSVAFPGMRRFVRTLLPELKDARMSNHPVQEIKKVIGDETFEKINSDTQNIFDLAQEDNLEQIKIENDKLKTYSNKIALQTDTLRYLSEAIKENAIGLANNLKKKGKTQLAKIAKSMYSLKTTIENLLKTREKSKQDEMERDK